MEKMNYIEARSADAIVDNDLAIISFLPVERGQPILCIGLRRDRLQKLIWRLTQQLEAWPEQSPQK